MPGVVYGALTKDIKKGFELLKRAILKSQLDAVKAGMAKESDYKKPKSELQKFDTAMQSLYRTLAKNTGEKDQESKRSAVGELYTEKRHTA